MREPSLIWATKTEALRRPAFGTLICDCPEYESMESDVNVP